MQSEPEQQAMNGYQQQHITYHHDSVSAVEDGEQEDVLDAATKPFVRQDQKVGRNDPCPCGSEKKYKQCHGRITQ